jgi:hypothetical protein
MATLNPSVVARSGYVVPAVLTSANSGGDQFTPGDDVFLHGKTSGTAVTAIVGTPGNVRGIPLGGAAAGLSMVFAATQERIWGPFPASLFASSTGFALITYAGGIATGFTIEVLRFPTS